MLRALAAAAVLAAIPAEAHKPDCPDADKTLTPTVKWTQTKSGRRLKVDITRPVASKKDGCALSIDAFVEVKGGTVEGDVVREAERLTLTIAPAPTAQLVIVDFRASHSSRKKEKLMHAIIRLPSLMVDLTGWTPPVVSVKDAPGCKVTIDGVFAGETPLDDYPVLVGIHVIEGQRANGNHWRRDVKINSSMQPYEVFACTE